MNDGPEPSSPLASKLDFELLLVFDSKSKQSVLIIDNVTSAGVHFENNAQRMRIQIKD